MKRKIKTLLTLALALCLVAVTAMPALALSRQEEYYLSVLRPALPKTAGAASYPARLLVTAPNLTYGGTAGNFTLHGKLGMDASISDEEMLSILKSGLAGEKSYKELQNPADDKVLVQNLTQKLKFSDQDLQDMLDNWKKLLGVDAVAELLSGKLPDIGASDAVNSIIDGLQGDIPMMPGLPGVGTVIDGAFVSWDEFQKDQQKYKDIIALSQAKQRLRSYYAKVDQLIRDFISDKGDWTLEINSQDVVEQMTFGGVDGNRQILTADIKLIKADGSAGNVTGTYTGHFKLRLEYDLTGFDKGYAQQCLDVYDGPKSSLRWGITTDEGSPSECYQVFEGEDYQVNLSLPAGVNRAFIEMPISAQPLFLTDYSLQIQRVVILGLSAVGISGWVDKSLNFDDYQTTEFDIGEIYLVGYGVNELVDSWDYNISEEFYPLPPEAMQMTLVVDML